MTPQSVHEIEELERRLTDALRELRERKRQLGGERAEAAAQSTP